MNSIHITVTEEDIKKALEKRYEYLEEVRKEKIARWKGNQIPGAENVTKEMIRFAGYRYSYFYNPVEVAVKKAFKSAFPDRPKVSMTYDCLAHIYGAGRVRMYDLPGSAKDHIVKFCQGHELKPFSFDLYIGGYKE